MGNKTSPPISPRTGREMKVRPIKPVLSGLSLTQINHIFIKTSRRKEGKKKLVGFVTFGIFLKKSTERKREGTIIVMMNSCNC